MYHAHRYSRNAWAGEPEIEPTMDYEEREQIEGWEMTPYECLDLAYGGVLREKYVQAGENSLLAWGWSKFKIWKCGYDHSSFLRAQPPPPHVPFLVFCLS
jgi:hypothetical protein